MDYGARVASWRGGGGGLDLDELASVVLTVGVAVALDVHVTRCRWLVSEFDRSGTLDRWMCDYACAGYGEADGDCRKAHLDYQGSKLWFLTLA